MHSNNMITAAPSKATHYITTRENSRLLHTSHQPGACRRLEPIAKIAAFGLLSFAITYNGGSFSTALAYAKSASSISSPTTVNNPSLHISTGLRNLGNTCYMNAQLQCAFHIPAVREIATLSRSTLPTEETVSEEKDEDSQQQKEESNEASLALKELFEGMIKAAEENTSAYVPKSFCIRLGIPPMIQQDSQEFWKLLLPAVGSEELTDLYKGIYVDYISTLDGSGRERRRDEIFLDLALDVSKSDELFQSLRNNFGDPELLSVADGNGWRPEKGADKVDAHKGSSLVAKGLPSILQFHLKRFNYDWQTDKTTKLQKKFTFPETLDMSSVCDNMSEEDKSLVQYDLQSIVVHVGEYGAGHYYAYVKPDMESDTWYRFNDDQVEKVPFEEVIKDAYGGRVKCKSSRRAKDGVLRRVKRLLKRKGSSSFGWGGEKSNAYVIQYVRRSDIPKLYNLAGLL